MSNDYNKNDETDKKKNSFERKSPQLKKKALAPCPSCGSWNTNVENHIFYCEDCGFEGG